MTASRCRSSLIALLATAALLAACGSDREEAPVEQADAETSTETTEAPRQSAEASRRAPGDAPEQEDGAGRATDEDEIELVIRALLTDPDSDAICSEAVTADLLAEAYGDIDGCLAGRPPRSLASEVEVEMLAVEGSKATVVARPSGGVYDGVPLDLALLRDGDRWRVDALSAEIPVGP